MEHISDGNRPPVMVFPPDHINWRQWAATALPLLLTGIVGIVGLFRVLEGRVLVSEQQIIHMTNEIEDHRRRLAILENTVNRNDERMKQVLEEVQVTRQNVSRLALALERERGVR